MLTTRCPECGTTFRITSQTLDMAAGKVRCGQCSAVFSAFDSLTDTQTRLPVDELLQSTMTEVPERSSESFIPDEKLDEVLEADLPPAEVPWRPAEREREPEAPIWRTAAILAALVLMLQGIHHYRGALTNVPFVGAGLESVYAFAGMPIPEDVDPASFAIVNWVATAQAVEEVQEGSDASLQISAGVRNTSDTALPYPLLSLELTDRWENTIGARVFTPDEYTGARLSSNARIRANTTVTAELQLVDPGPDAYGFEVDICVPVDGTQMRCKQTDELLR